MPQDSSAKVTRTAEPAAFELKGAVSPLTVLRLRTDDLVRIEVELWDRVERAPRMLLNAPVVVDVSALEGAGAGVDFERLIAALRRCQVVPVAVANLPVELAASAARAGLGTIPLGPTRARRLSEPAPVESPAPVEATPAPAPEAAPAPAAEAAPEAAPAAAEAEAEPTVVPAAAVSTMTIRQPVRGGQVVYAQRGDLVVLAAVNAGAQVIADGHIHIYGPLRGRALAGASGNADARIFCQQLSAELISVAGEYLLADEIPDTLRGRPAQVFQKDGRCCVAPL
jgi:septum site-determining protein MinC